MNKLTTHLAGLAAAAVAAGALGFVGSAPAQAYVGECNSRATRTLGTWRTTVPVRNGSGDCWMDLGSTGYGVRALQDALNKCYGAGLAVDGSFGTGTQSALKSAQRREGISPDGGYGTQTRTHLNFYGYDSVEHAWSCADAY